MSSTPSGENVVQLIRAKLTTSKGGHNVRPTLENTRIILELDSRWAGVLAWDEFRGRIFKLKLPPCGGDVGPWCDIDTLRAADWISSTYKVDITKNMVADAAHLVADKCTFNPLVDWLRSLRWDGALRIDRLFIDYFGAPDSFYIREVGRNLLIGAVNRALTPGIALHEVVILEGRQGAGKSRGVKVLFGKEYFSDTPLEVGNKDAFLVMRGKWCIELGELSSMSKTDANAMKVFVASPTDSYRRPYAREPEDIPRRCVFIGTTNDSEYLQDSTGNRRWLPVEVGEVRWHDIERDRTQLWAEAFERSGEDFWLSPAALSQALEMRSSKNVDDPWLPLVETWLEGRPGPVTTTELLQGAVGKDPSTVTRGDQSRVGRIIQSLGWAKRQLSTGKRVYENKQTTGLADGGLNLKLIK